MAEKNTRISSHRQSGEHETDTHILCLLCSRWFRAITFTHLKYKHQVQEPQDYKDEFSLTTITPSDVRRKVANSKRVLTTRHLDYLKSHWGKRPLVEISSRLGINASTARAYAKQLGLPLFVKRWDKQQVLKEIRRARRNRQALHSGGIRVSSPRLYKAARSHFRSWKRAVSAAGLDYSQVARRAPFEHWTRDRIIREIEMLSRRRKHQDYRYLERFHSKLYAAGRNHFGNWRRALDAWKRARPSSG